MTHGELQLPLLDLAAAQRLPVRGALGLTVDTRLIAVDADGTQVTELVQAEKGDYIPQIQDRVLSFLPDDPGHILLELPKVDRMSRSPASASTIQDRLGHPEVVKVDLRTGATETVVPMNGQINNWISDHAGGWRAIYEYSLSEKRFVRAVAQDAQGDLDAIVRGDEIVAFEDGSSRLRYLSNDWGNDARLIDKALHELKALEAFLAAQLK